MHSFSARRRSFTPSRSLFGRCCSTIARSYASGVVHSQEPSFSVCRGSPACASPTTTPTTRMTADVVFMLFPVRAFFGERFEICAELRDLGIVQDVFPRRHLPIGPSRSEEHTSELQSLTNLVC